MSDELREFQAAVYAKRMAEWLHDPKVGMEFPTEEALKTYMKDHPGADPENHSVKKDDHGGAEDKGEGSGGAHKAFMPKALRKVVDDYDLNDADLAEVHDFKKRKPPTGKHLTDAQLMQKFLREAKPETKERMKGMSVADFKVMMAAIMDDEG